MAVLVETPNIEAFGFRWIVIRKPVGMLAHTVGDEEADVIHWLENHLHENTSLAKGCQYDPQYDLHPIHRLDREVSGLMLIALDKKTAHQLHRQFEDREIEKCYYALVDFEKQDHEPKGLWKWKLTKKAEGRSKPAGFSKYRVACSTEYEIVTHDTSHALLKLIPHTGRKHQLRRHCAMAGLPIVGDSRYGHEHDDGLQLMSCLIAFKDPSNHERVKVEIEPILKNSPF